MESVNSHLEQLITLLQNRLSDTVSSLSNHPVHLSLKHGATLPITDAQSLLESTTAKTTTVYIPLMGDITGDIFVFLPEPSDARLADLMIGNQPGTTTVLGPFESSAIQELGNIMTGVVVTEIANLFKISVILTVPNIATDMAGALIDQVLIEYGTKAKEMLAISFPFVIEEAGVNGSFLVLFDYLSSQTFAQHWQEVTGTA